MQKRVQMTMLTGLLIGVFLFERADCQSPIAQIELADKTLEIWSIEKGSSVHVKSDDAYPFLFGFVDELQKWKDSGSMPIELQRKMGIQYSRWEPTRERDFNSYAVLGTLLRDSDGKVSSSILGYSTAMQVTDSQGRKSSNWDSNAGSKSDCLLSDRATYRWSEQVLTPLPIKVADDAAGLKTVDAFAVILPVTRHTFRFDINELKRGERKSDGSVTVVPINFQSNSSGTEVAFQVFRPLPELKGNKNKSNGSKDAKTSHSKAELFVQENIAERESGERANMSLLARNVVGQWIAPQGSVSVSRALQFNQESAVKSELKLRAKGKDSSSNVAATASDKKKAVGNIRVEASGYKYKETDLEQMEVVVVLSNGLETIEKFQLRDIELKGFDRRQELQSYLTGLERSTVESQAKPSKSIRVWKDTSGKFSLEAELVLFDGKKVVLKNRDGKTTEVPFEKLSAADRDYLDKL